MRVVGPPTSGPPKVAKAERRPPKLRLDRPATRLRGSVIEVPITCPSRERTGAVATVTLFIRVPRPAGRGRRRRSLRTPIATQTVDLGTGERRLMRFELGRKHRMMLRRRRSRGLTAEIVAVDHRGITGRQSAKLTV